MRLPLKAAFWAVLSAALPLPAAFDDIESGVRPLAMGGAFTACADDADALHWNPAGLARQDCPGMTAGIFRPFGLTALQYQAVSAVYPVGAGAAGAGMKVLGQSGYYREETAVFSYARTLRRRWAWGVSLRYMALEIGPVYGSDWCTGIDAGVMWYPLPAVSIGAGMRNLNAPSLSLDHERLAPAGGFGAAFRPVTGVVVTADAYRDARYPLQVRLGQETVLLKHVAVRCGMQTSPARFTVGAGISTERFGCDYALYSHPVLGFTHQAGIRLKFGRKDGRAGRGAAPADN